MASPYSGMNSNLTQFVLAQTAGEHMKTVKSEFFTKLKEGTLNGRQYHQYLTDQLHINNMLEAKVQSCIEKDIRFVNADFVGIARTPGIQMDLNYTVFIDITSQPTKEAVLYCKYLKTLSPVKFFGHFYTKYLGDLSAAEIFKKQVADKWPHYFYDFSDLLIEHQFSDTYKFKNEKFKPFFDALPLSSIEVDEFVGEVKNAFDFLGKVVEADLGKEHATEPVPLQQYHGVLLQG